jgi:hypothetical protein
MTLFRRSQAARAICLAFFLLLSFCRPLPMPAPDTCSGSAAEPDREFNRLFQRSGNGWTGGDGTLSVALPDGRTLWLFGDSFLGNVFPDRSRPSEAPFIRNSMIVQKGAALETLYQSAGGSPVAFFDPDAADHWYWPGHGVVEDGTLKIFLHRFEQTEPRLWSWRWVGNELAELSLPSLSLSGFAAAPSDNEVLYGVCILETEAFTYIYGAADLRMPKEAHLARAPAGNVQGPWQYFNGSSWSEIPADTAPVLSGVSTQFAVLQTGTDFYLFSMDGRTAFSSEIVVYRAGHPWGPWQGPLVIYRAPEATEAVFAYNPFVHPQFTEAGRVLLSYNLNHVSDPSAVYRDADIYRPRFIRVDMSQVAGHFRAE